MAAVQQAQLHRLERKDVAHELCAGVLPRRPRGAEAVFDDPLAERLGRHRRVVLQAREAFRLGDVRRGVAGTIRSTMVDGKDTCSPIQVASAGSRRAANAFTRPSTMRRCAGGCRSTRRSAARPLPSGAPPICNQNADGRFRRRRCAKSCAMSRCSSFSFPVAGSWQ